MPILKPRIIIDSAIPYIKGILEPYAEVLYMAGDAISNYDARRADALVIRTRTKCNGDLLSDTPVKIIATATIGTDHIDEAFCRNHGIEVKSAPGCNADGVCQWVLSALDAISNSEGLELKGKTIGVIGVGNVGSKVVTYARENGMNVIMNDPPRQKCGENGFFPLNYLLKNSDIVTLHVPLAEDTRNLASNDFFDKMKNGALFLNCSRGEVVDEDALLKSIDKLGGLAIDVWRNEPDINKLLLEKVNVATMHIAGYSKQGKINATNMVLEAVCDFFDFPLLLSSEGAGETNTTISIYDIMSDDTALRSNPHSFEELRNNYNYR